MENMLINNNTSWYNIEKMIIYDRDLFDPGLNKRMFYNTYDHEEYIAFMKDTPMLRKAFLYACEVYALNSLKGILDNIDDWENPVYRNIYVNKINRAYQECNLEMLELFINHPKRNINHIKGVHKLAKDMVNKSFSDQVDELIKESEKLVLVTAATPEKWRQIYEEIIEACEKDVKQDKVHYYNELLLNREFKSRIGELTSQGMLYLLNSLCQSKFKNITSKLMINIGIIFRQNIEKYSDIKIDLLKIYLLDYGRAPADCLVHFTNDIISHKYYKYNEVIEMFEKMVQEISSIALLLKISYNIHDFNEHYTDESDLEMYHRLMMKIHKRMKEIKKT